MKRRTVLALVAGGALPVAGCLGAGGSADATSRSTPPPTPSSTPPVNTGGVSEFDPETVHERVEVGTRPTTDGPDGDAFRPHDVAVLNAAADERTVGVRILDRLADRTAHRDTYRVPADAAVELSLLRPSKYYVQVWGPAVDAETLLVPCDSFDCNGSTTEVRIDDSGEVASTVVSTLLACETFEC